MEAVEEKKKGGFRGGDHNINRAGRPKRDPDAPPKNATKRELKDRELLMLLRKIKPHVSEAIMTASKIMGDEKAPEQHRLKAATILLDNYRKLVLDTYMDGADDDEGEEIQQQNAPVFSLRVIESE